MVAIIFYRLGIVSHVTAVRVVYLDAILYLGSGIVGTGHHWYWTGQSHVTMALGATFSAMEVVPLTLLALEAWNFISVTGARCDVCGKELSVPHKWTFYFLISVGFWNFVGAGIMGVFGMLAMALMVLAVRQMANDTQWASLEKYIKVSFWGLNIGLALMLLTNLFPGGVLQMLDVLNNGYWHARGPEFLSQKTMHLIEWLRIPGDVIFIMLGVVPAVIASLLAYKELFNTKS